MRRHRHIKSLIAGLAAATSLIATTLIAERLPVRTWTTADGLPRDRLQCVHVDARGFVWFCTPDGLVRFDGHAAVVFGRNEGLNPPGVRSFIDARDGHFWAGADAGLFEFTPTLGRFRSLPRDDGHQTGAVNGLGQSGDGSIWVATGRGLLRLIHSGDGEHLREVEIGLPRDSENDQIVRAALEDEHGTLWAGAASGLYERRADGRTVRLTTRDGLPVNEVWALAVDSAGRLWAATREGLCVIDRRAVGQNDHAIVRRVLTSRDGLPASNVKALYRDGETLWVGTVAGFAEVSLTPAGKVTVSRALTGFNAWAIGGDARGDVWVATDAGARRLTSHGFTTYLKQDGLAASQVSSLFETLAGEVCATTLVGRFKLSCFDGMRFKHLPIKAAESVGDPGWGWSQLTLQDRRGRWWIPTGAGLLQFAAGPASALATAVPAATYDVSRGLRSNNVFRLFEDSRGGIWVATFAEAGNGLARIDPPTGDVHAFGPADGLSGELPIVHAFAEDHSGAIWVGLEQGRLLRYQAGRFRDIQIHTAPAAPPPQALTFEHVRSLLIDRQGRLWMASTVSGVGRVDDPRAASVHVRWYGTKHGLASDTAWALVEDASGDLFVGTGRGVDRFNPSTERVVHYSADEGVPRAEIWGALRDRAGRIWFATNDGAARFAVADERPATPPLTLVTAVRVAGVPVSIGAAGASRVDAITLEPGDRRIEIDFVSPGAREADGLRYQHQLEGVDRDWTATEARSVSLAGAAPGRYRFLVRAALASGIIGDSARVEFTVLAPVWRRWWFIALITACIAALALGVHRARVERLVEVERVRSRIAADLHDGVGASLSRIAIVSEVVRRQAEAALPDAVPALVSIGDGARELIDDMRDAVWFIDPRLDNLQEIVVRARAMSSDLFDDRHIAWTLDAPEHAADVALAPEQRRHVYLILKESLNNVLRHAQASHVAIRITTADRRLRLEIADDGVGCEGAESRSTIAGGRGLANMRSRAAALGGALTVAPAAAGRGTRVVLEAPMRLTA